MSQSQQRQSWSVQTHLMFFSLALIAPILILITVFVTKSAEYERAAVGRSVDRIVQALTAAVDRDLAAVVQTLNVLATSSEIARGDLAGFSAQASKLAKLDIQRLVLIDRRGKLVVDTSVPFGTTDTNADPVFWRRTVATKKTDVSGLFRDSQADGAFRYAVNVPIVENGDVEYVLTAVLAPKRVTDILTNNRLPEGWIAGASDLNGHVLSRTKNPERFIGSILPPELLSGPPADGALWRTVNLDGVPVLRVEARSALAGWRIAATVPSVLADRAVTQSWQQVGILTATFAIFSGMLAWLFGRRIAAPVYQLAANVRSTGQGLPSAPFASGVRELNEVADAMADATRELQLKRDALQLSETSLRASEERLKLALSSSDTGAWDRDLKTGEMAWDGRMRELFGLDASEPVDFDIFIRCIHPDDRAATLASIERSRDPDVRTEYRSEYRVNARKTGRVRWVASEGRTTFVGGIPVRMTGIAKDITDIKVSQAALRETENRLRRVLDNLFSFVGIMDLEGILIETNEAPLTVAGIKRADVIGKKYWDCFWWTWDPGVSDGVRDAVKQAAAGASARYDVEIQVENGERLMIDFQVAPLRNDDGVITHLLASGTDVTERTKREQHINLLLREISHRSKNLLAVIQAMARQTRAGSRTVAEFEERFSARVQALAASHDLLVQRDWHGVWMNDLVRSQLGHHIVQNASRIETAGPPIEVAPEAAQNIGLAIHELASNAARFGALSVPAGRISLTWNVEGAGETDQRLRVSWIESGGPEVSAPTGRGFGQIVAEHVAARALDGTAQLQFLASGVQWTLTIPARYILS